MALREVVTAIAAAFAVDSRPVPADIRVRKATSLRAIAAQLTDRGTRTQRGGAWGLGNVQGLGQLKPGHR